MCCSIIYWQRYLPAQFPTFFATLHNLFPTVNLTSALKKMCIYINICFEQSDLRGMWNSVDHIALGRAKFMLRDPGMQFPAPRSQKFKESELILCAPGRAQRFGFRCVLFGFSQKCRLSNYLLGGGSHFAIC